MVKKGNFLLLLTSSGQERQFLIATDIKSVVKNGNVTLLLTSSGQEWSIPTLLLTSSGQEW